MKAYPQTGTVLNLLTMAGCRLNCARYEAGHRRQLSILIAYYRPSSATGKTLETARRQVGVEMRNDIRQAFWDVITAGLLLRAGGPLR